MRYVVFGLGIIVGLLGLAAALFGLNDPLIRSIGIVMCLGGAYLLKIAKAREPRGGRNLGSQRLSPQSRSRSGRLLWILCAVLLAAWVASFFLMNNDAMHGHQHVWTVYAFIVTGTLFTVASACVVGMLVWKTFNR